MTINFIFVNVRRSSEVLGFSIETHTTPGGSKNVARVVIVNEHGQRVLDTYIKPQFSECHTKQGIKSSLFLLAKTKGEPIKDLIFIKILVIPFRFSLILFCLLFDLQSHISAYSHSNLRKVRQLNPYLPSA